MTVALLYTANAIQWLVHE